MDYSSSHQVYTHVCTLVKPSIGGLPSILNLIGRRPARREYKSTGSFGSGLFG
jgi:hypothetical protein